MGQISPILGHKQMKPGTAWMILRGGDMKGETKELVLAGLAGLAGAAGLAALVGTETGRSILDAIAEGVEENKERDARSRAAELEDRAIDSLRDALAAVPWDDDRMRLLRQSLPERCSGEQAVRLLRTFTWADGKESALALLLPRIPSHERALTAGAFNFWGTQSFERACRMAGV